ncbi:MAG TPA: hypothetical protein VIV57_17910 [Anaeromyxobacter sp.]
MPYNALVKLRLRLPFESQLPPSGPRRLAVLAMLALGGLVALLVPVFFAVVLLSFLRGR